MVVFTCAHCGESVNKPKVEKHYLTRCRGRAPDLSCMDCFRDFRGNEHESHTKCISEEQRYSAKGFVAKVNKGEAKQTAWVEMVQTVLDEQKNAPKNVIRIVEEICKHSNTPRKKPKFINFVRNVCGHRTMQNDIDAAWDLISVKLSALSNANKQNQHNGIKKADESNKTEEDGDTKEDVPEENGNETNVSAAENGDEKKEKEEVKSKKQRKEEKKRKKYEAELENAGVQQADKISDEAGESEKKKKKSEKQNENGEMIMENGHQNLTKKGKKRKNTESEPNEDEPQESKGKTNKKKQKIVKEVQNGDESISLHDQNVAASENLAKGKGDNFDWLGVIVSLLQKKGNEMPFKRLQKKVLAEYAESTGKEAGDRIVDKLNKKLRGAPNVRVDKNIVMLIES